MTRTRINLDGFPNQITNLHTKLAEHDQALDTAEATIAAPTAFPALVGVAVYVSGSFNVTPQNTLMVVTAFDTQIYDTAGNGWDVSDPGKLYAREAGYYLVRGGIHWTGNVDSTARQIHLQKNGSINCGMVCHPPVPVGGVSTHQIVTAVVQMAAGDYVQLVALQNAAASLSATISVGQSFSITKIAR